jgi:phage tail sheath protein FI
VRPGVDVVSSAGQATRGEPTDNGTWFVTGFAEQGPSDEAVEITSLNDFEDTFGGRVAYSQLWDALELFFAEGGAVAYVGRVVGPDPVKASVTFDDGAAADALKVEALYEGDYANGAAGGLSAEIVAGTGGTRTLIVYDDGVEVERYIDWADAAEIVGLLASSDYVRGTDLAGGLPAVAAEANLAGGTDDHANASEDEWTATLDLFGEDLGPGQVSAPGRTTTAAQQALIAHARTHKRSFYLDTVDLASKATLLAAVAAIEDEVGAEYGGLFGTWYEIPGLVEGTVRAVPGSAFAAGVTNRVDALEGTSGVAPAGEVSLAQYAVGVRTPAGGLTDADYEELNDAGVNMGRAFRNRGVQLYGFRSISKDPNWVQLTANRLRVSLTARHHAIGLRYVFKPPSKATFADLNAELVAECLRDYNAGALYGESPDEAFRVDTGDTVNTAETAAAGEINAITYGRFTPFGELVQLAVVKVPISSPV